MNSLGSGGNVVDQRLSHPIQYPYIVSHTTLVISLNCVYKQINPSASRTLLALCCTAIEREQTVNKLAIVVNN